LSEQESAEFDTEEALRKCEESWTPLCSLGSPLTIGLLANLHLVLVSVAVVLLVVSICELLVLLLILLLNAEEMDDEEADEDMDVVEW
jgi:hypothetical protein